MKKKTLAVFATLIILMGSLLVGCAQGQTTAQGTTIGIIGAMDEEVAMLKEAAKITKTTSIAQACYLNNTPFVVIRAISDKSDGSQSMEYETFKAAAAANCAKIVEYMVDRL